MLEATAQKTAPCKVCLCRRAVPGRVYWRERPGGGAGWPAARARLRGTAPDPSALRTSRCCSDSSMARMTSIICPFAASDMEQTRPGRRRFSRDCALRRRLCQTSIVSLRVCTQHQRLRSRRCVSTPPPSQSAPGRACCDACPVRARPPQNASGLLLPLHPSLVPLSVLFFIAALPLYSSSSFSTPRLSSSPSLRGPFSWPSAPYRLPS